MGQVLILTSCQMHSVHVLRSAATQKYLRVKKEGGCGGLRFLDQCSHKEIVDAVTVYI